MGVAGRRAVVLPPSPWSDSPQMGRYSSFMNHNEAAEALRLAEELLGDIELSQIPIDKQVLKCARLARIMNNVELIEWLNREKNGYFKGDAEKYPRFRETGRVGKTDDDHVYAGVVQLQPYLHTMELELAQLRVPNVSSEYARSAIMAVTDRIAGVRNAIVKYQLITSRVSGMLHTSVSAIYLSLRFSGQQDTMFEKAKSEIDTRISKLDEILLQRVDAAYSNLRVGNPESVSAAMNSVRRLIDGFTDSVFPASGETRPHPIPGKPPLRMTQQNTLNRLRAFIDDNAQSRSRSKRLGESAESIYARVSNGVHNDASTSEAEYLFLTSYILLGEILNLPGATGEETVDVEVSV